MPKSDFETHDIVNPRPSANSRLAKQGLVAGEARSFAPIAALEPRKSVDHRPFAPGAICHPESVQYELAHWNRERLGPSLPQADWYAEHHRHSAMLLLESTWIETLRAEVYDQAQAAARTPEGFTEWFEALGRGGPGEGDSLFLWLAEKANADAMCWFLTQEAAGETGLDHLVALTQIKLPAGPKLELARNFGGGTGRSDAGVHGPLLSRAVEELNLKPTLDAAVWPSLALANTMTAFDTVRRYTWHLVGALRVAELTAPPQMSRVGMGLKRLGFPPTVRKYFDLHAALDQKHSEDWNTRVLFPLAHAMPECMPFIAEGALMRLLCVKRCFAAYREHLWKPTAMSH